MDLEEKNTLFKIRRTVLEMISDRKYIIPLSENIDFEEFIIKYNNKNLDIHGDGAQRRVFCHVDDAVRGVIDLWRHSEGDGEAFNVGGIEETSILDLAKKIIGITNSSSKVNFIPYAELKSQGFEDMQRRVPSTEKLKKLTGWVPTMSLDKILSDYLSSVRKC